MPFGASSSEQPPATDFDFFPAVGEDPEAYSDDPDWLLAPEEDRVASRSSDAETEPRK